MTYAIVAHHLKNGDHAIIKFETLEEAIDWMDANYSEQEIEGVYSRLSELAVKDWNQTNLLTAVTEARKRLN